MCGQCETNHLSAKTKYFLLFFPTMTFRMFSVKEVIMNDVGYQKRVYQIGCDPKEIKFRNFGILVLTFCGFSHEIYFSQQTGDQHQRPHSKSQRLILHRWKSEKIFRRFNGRDFHRFSF